MHNEALKVQKVLEEVLGKELAEIVSMVSNDPFSAKSYFIGLPDSDSIDYTAEDLASYVVKTSNMYGRISRQAGMVRAQYKLVESDYKRKFKAAKVGKNENERERAAVLATEKEAEYLAILDAVISLIEAAEQHSRIASESSRKLLDKLASMDIAHRRESAGFFSVQKFD